MKTGPASNEKMFDFFLRYCLQVYVKVYKASFICYVFTKQVTSFPRVMVYLIINTSLISKEIPLVRHLMQLDFSVYLINRIKRSETLDVYRKAK